MANTYITPTGVTLGTGETTVFTATTETMLMVRFSNVDTVTRNLNAFLYTGGGPGADATRLVPLDFPLGSGQQLELGPLYLPSGYTVTATASSANKINAIPNGIATT